jgi:tripartite-type tricarboxylate transporter receptor subunit TctC
MPLHRDSRRTFLARAGNALASTSPWLRPAAAAMGLGATGAQSTTTSAPLHILCSGPAASIPDIVARRVAEQLGIVQSKRVVVDNRPGAAGQLAVAALKNGPADGSSILIAQGAIATVYPYLYPKLAYDPGTDLMPVSLAGEMTLALAVGPAVPASVTNVRGLLAWMRREPALANAGSPGTGTLPHLLEAMLFRAGDVPWQHIAYSGGPPGMVALLGGQIAAMVLPEGLFLQHRAAGRLRVLATSGAQRTALMADVPTLVEQGFADLIVREWFGFFLPGRASPAVADAASVAMRQALAQPALVNAFTDAGMVAVSSTPAELVTRIAAEQRTWEPILRALGVRVE